MTNKKENRLQYANNVTLNQNLNLSLASAISYYNEKMQVYAEADFNKGSSAINLNWQSTFDEGKFDIYTSTDGNNYTLQETVTGANTYAYPTNDSTNDIYFKVKQTLNNAFTKESNSVKMIYNAELCEYELEEVDTDGEGLTDTIEFLIETDKNVVDTDGDGLSDYAEVYLTGTDPLYKDSDENGVLDCDEDPDSDGLTNINEIELGTEPQNIDSDYDDLTDGDEVNTYGTKPLVFDTDEDKIGDGDEIKLGLNPLNPQTFGIPDSEYTFDQTVLAESEDFSQINTVENPYKLSMDIKAAGKVDGNLIVSESGYSTVMKNDAILGIIPELKYDENLKVESVKLSFKINDEFIDNTGSEYAESNSEFVGIKRYNIFKYFEDDNILLPIKTDFDVENNIMYTEVDELGTYCIMDMEKWLSALGIAPENNLSETNSAIQTDSTNTSAQYSSTTVTLENYYSSGPVNHTISNDYIAFHVNDSGYYTIGTVSGDPLLSTDDNKKLLYGYPGGSTTKTTIRIDGTNYTFATNNTNYDQSHLTATSSANYNGVNVEQELKIIENTATGRYDVVQIKYRVKNTNSYPIPVGVRIMMDTMLGNNDAAPFRVLGKTVTTETEYSGSNIPQMWQAFDSITNPGVIAQGTFFKSETNKPDKVQFTNWSGVYNTIWDYAVSNGASNGDSAVSAIWNEKSLAPGAEYEYTTYYGLSEFTSDLRPPLALSVYADNKLEKTNNKYSPLIVSSYVDNIGNGNADNVKLSIEVPQELQLVTNNSDYSNSPFALGCIKPQEQKNVVWLLKVKDNYTYSTDKSVDIKINLEYTNSSNGKIETKQIIKKVLIQQNEFNAINATGLKKIVLDAPLSKYSLADTDDDTLLDWNEVDTESGLIKWDSDGAIILPTIQDCINYKSHLTYVKQGLDRFKNENIGYSYYSYLLQQTILPIKSDPTSTDGDGDGIEDTRDKTRLENSKWDSKSTLAKAVEFAGFKYDPNQDIIYSKMNPLQRYGGYCKFYDESIGKLSCYIDCEPIYFEAKDSDGNAKEWMIELWKGQYGIETGGEIGVYYRNANKSDNVFEKYLLGTFYNCADNDDLLNMYYSFYDGDGNLLFTRGFEDHWWLTGFKWGEYTDNPAKLTMKITIDFENKTEMRENFVSGLIKTGYKNQDISVDNNKVSFIFKDTKTEQPEARKELFYKSKIQDNNKKLVADYEIVYQALELNSNDPNNINIEEIEQHADKELTEAYNEILDYYNKYVKILKDFAKYERLVS